MSQIQLIRIIVLLMSTLLFSCAHATEVAITIDDFPGVGPLPAGVTRLDVENQMIATFQKYNIQNVYGMVIGGEVVGSRKSQKIIDNWIANGHYVANHSYSHSDLAKVDADFYINDIQKTDDYLSQLKQAGTYKYFRYPYLSDGNTKAKRTAVRAYLFSHGYQIAPVTINFSDYAWNAPYARCVKQNNTEAIAWLKQIYIQEALSALDEAHYSSNQLFHRDIKNILLLHLGPFDAVMLGDLINAYQQRGVTFISLNDAMTDPVYKLNLDPNRVQPYTLSKRTESKDDPIVPITSKQVAQKLQQICR